MLPKGHLDAIVAGARSGAAHGYAIIERSRTAAAAPSTCPRTVYPALARLELQGCWPATGPRPLGPQAPHLSRQERRSALPGAQAWGRFGAAVDASEGGAHAGVIDHYVAVIARADFDRALRAAWPGRRSALRDRRVGSAGLRLKPSAAPSNASDLPARLPAIRGRRGRSSGTPHLDPLGNRAMTFSHAASRHVVDGSATACHAGAARRPLRVHLGARCRAVGWLAFRQALLPPAVCLADSLLDRAALCAPACSSRGALHVLLWAARGALVACCVPRVAGPAPETHGDVRRRHERWR